MGRHLGSTPASVAWETADSGATDPAQFPSQISRVNDVPTPTFRRRRLIGQPRRPTSTALSPHWFTMMSAAAVPALRTLLIGHWFKSKQLRDVIGSKKHVGVSLSLEASKQLRRHLGQVTRAMAEMRCFQNKSASYLRARKSSIYGLKSTRSVKLIYSQDSYSGTFMFSALSCKNDSKTKQQICRVRFLF